MAKLLNVMAALAVAGLLIACAGAKPSAAPTGGPSRSPTSAPTGAPTVAPSGAGATTVAVTLQEFSVITEPASAPAGDVTFAITNTGPDDVHEFVILRTDLAPDALPTKADGSVDEEGEGMEVIDGLEDLAVGASEELTATLEAGSYVLICNIFDDEEQEAHYEMGMRTAFTVE